VILNKAVSIIKRDGLKWFFVRVFGRLLGQEMEICRTKQKALSILEKKYKNQIAYGLFKGMKLTTSNSWDPFSKINQILGTYEEHVLQELLYFKEKGINCFIDIGAADGYFAVGMAYSQTFENIYAFEISRLGQEIILDTATQNQCEQLITINGEANSSTIAELIWQHKQAVFLIDIEGAEYTFLNLEMLDLLKNCCVICELHPWLIEKGYELQNILLSTASERFDINIIKREVYRPNNYEEFDDFTDEERLIAVGEGRHKNMQWLVLKPKLNQDLN
jgi:hypothetical protein